ncbi:MAG TPA: RDD family protein [Gaiellaceae bacterium]|nr:RDD family protein [Gaiellaceae bacterium]
MSDLPTYPQDAAEREAAAPPSDGERTYASWGSRVGAYLLDTLIIVVPLVVLIIVAVAVDVWALILLGYLGTLVVPFVYFTYFHGGASGQTPGKRALGIRVVSDDAVQTIGYGRAFGRYAITVLFSFFFIPLLLDYLWPLWDTKNQALHDKVVSSVVVRA